jgi:hypothetical protein
MREIKTLQGRAGRAQAYCTSALSVLVDTDDAMWSIAGRVQSVYSIVQCSRPVIPLYRPVYV